MNSEDKIGIYRKILEQLDFRQYDVSFVEPHTEAFYELVITNTKIPAPWNEEEAFVHARILQRAGKVMIEFKTFGKTKMGENIELKAELANPPSYEDIIDDIDIKNCVERLVSAWMSILSDEGQVKFEDLNP